MIRISSLPLLVMVILTVLIYTGCNNQAPQQAPPPPAVTVKKPLLTKIVEWDEYTGRLDAKDSVEVRARVSGYLESIHFKEGEIVEKGQLLFVIDPRPFEAALNRAKGELELAQAKQNLAESNLARATKLLEANAISKEEFDTRESEAEQSKASLNSAQAAVEEAKLNLEFTKVKAPIRGRISREQVTEGNLINGGSSLATLLTTIVSLNPIYCYFEIDEKSYLKYTTMWNSGKESFSDDVSRPVYISLSDNDALNIKGNINFVDNQVNTSTATMMMRAVISNDDFKLVPGLFAHVLMQASPEYEALLVPDEAVGTDQSQTFVLVVNSDNKVEYKKVQLGPLKGSFRVIESGIQPEDRIIVKGLQKVQPGAPVNPQEEDIDPGEQNFLTPRINTARAENN